jgi:hypothetical protein
MTIQMSLARVLALLTVFLAPLVAHANPLPQQGRFLQRDPNGSGQIVLNDATWRHGEAPYINPLGVSIESMYGDGMSLYAYLRSNPVNHTDPMGCKRDVLRKIRAYEAGAFEMMDLIMERDSAILLGLVGGSFFSKICFVEGTLIATPDGQEAIEQLALGREVHSQRDPEFDGVEAALCAPNDAISLVRLRYRHADSSVTTMELLRPSSLLKALGVVAGSRLPVALPEMGFAGNAEVCSVEPYGEPIRLDVPVVTARFTTDFAEVVDILFEGGYGPVGVTPRHPVFSVDRQSWVASGELRVGEQLRSAEGIAIVASVAPRPERAPVHNVEINLHHTYFVGEAKVWAHNPCTVTSKIRDKALIRAAEAAGRNRAVQTGMDHLVGQLRAGNLNAGERRWWRGALSRCATAAVERASTFAGSPRTRSRSSPNPPRRTKRR